MWWKAIPPVSLTKVVSQLTHLKSQNEFSFNKQPLCMSFLFSNFSKQFWMSAVMSQNTGSSTPSWLASERQVTCPYVWHPTREQPNYFPTWWKGITQHLVEIWWPFIFPMCTLRMCNKIRAFQTCDKFSILASKLFSMKQSVDYFVTSNINKLQRYWKRVVLRLHVLSTPFRWLLLCPLNWK